LKQPVDLTISPDEVEIVVPVVVAPAGKVHGTESSEPDESAEAVETAVHQENGRTSS
jgi:hypothetical protein